MQERAAQAGDPRALEWFAVREAERPDITGDAVLLYAAFQELQGDRPIIAGAMSAAVGPIPYTAARQWAVDHGIEPGSDEFDWLREGLDALMTVQMKHESDERAKLADKNKPKR